jgi:hypothetical protein
MKPAILFTFAVLSAIFLTNSIASETGSSINQTSRRDSTLGALTYSDVSFQLPRQLTRGGCGYVQWVGSNDVGPLEDSVDLCLNVTWSPGFFHINDGCYCNWFQGEYVY